MTRPDQPDPYEDDNTGRPDGEEPPGAAGRTGGGAPRIPAPRVSVEDGGGPLPEGWGFPGRGAGAGLGADAGSGAGSGSGASSVSGADTGSGAGADQIGRAHV